MLYSFVSSVNDYYVCGPCSIPGSVVELSICRHVWLNSVGYPTPYPVWLKGLELYTIHLSGTSHTLLIGFHLAYTERKLCLLQGKGKDKVVPVL
jgi:hypothetical protein